MAVVPPHQTARILEFIEMVANNISDKRGISTASHAPTDAALALLDDMSHQGIGLTFPDPAPKPEAPWPAEESPF